MTTTANHRRDTLAQIAADIRNLSNLSIDLDGFLALTSEERAARWRGLDLGGKFQLVAQQIARKFGDWDLVRVEVAIETYDRKWGEAPTTIESAVSAALERLAEESAQSARTARAAGERDDAKFFQRSANAFARALLFYRAGLRPHPTTQGGWLLPSQRPGEAPHLLTMSGDWTCTCAAGESMHWAKALIIGIEVGTEDMDRFDGGDEGPADPVEAGNADDCGETAASLGQRIALARARVMQEAA